jgi:hypothetical protein
MRSPKMQTSPSSGPARQNTSKSCGYASPSPSQPAMAVASPDGGVSPDEPDADEFELIGGIDDLGAADLGPITPDARDPDADSGRPRKITPDSGRDTGTGHE